MPRKKNDLLEVLEPIPQEQMEDQADMASARCFWTGRHQRDFGVDGRHHSWIGHVAGIRPARR